MRTSLRGRGSDSDRIMDPGQLPLIHENYCVPVDNELDGPPGLMDPSTCRYVNHNNPQVEIVETTRFHIRRTVIDMTSTQMYNAHSDDDVTILEYEEINIKPSVVIRPQYTDYCGNTASNLNSLDKLLIRNSRMNVNEFNQFRTIEQMEGGSVSVDDKVGDAGDVICVDEDVNSRVESSSSSSELELMMNDAGSDEVMNGHVRVVMSAGPPGIEMASPPGIEMNSPPELEMEGPPGIEMADPPDLIMTREFG